MERAFVAGYLGGKTDHFDSLEQAFRTTGVKLVMLPDLATWGEGKGLWGSGGPGSGKSGAGGVGGVVGKLRRRVKRAGDQLWGTRNDAYVREVAEMMDREGVSCVVAYWGTGALADIAGIKRKRPGVPVVLNVLCHPIGLTGGRIWVQNRFFGRMARHLDGIIYSSEAMRRYFGEKVLGGAGGVGSGVKELLWPPYYSESLFPKVREQACEDRPNVLFLGRMDWKRSQACDNVTGFIDALLDCGVHVYHAQTSHKESFEALRGHRLRHTFPYTTLPEAEKLATRFAASLIVYNLEGSRGDRFNNTVPDRLLASVSAGIPIALPREGYAACHEYLKAYEAVITFTSAGDLAEQLKDAGRMEALRRVAVENSRKYAGERHVGELVGFMRELAGGGR